MVNAQRSWRRRSPLMSFLHSYRILLGAVLFSLLTAVFVAIHLGFFSTLLVYIPLVVICIPAFTAVEAADYKSMRAWPKRRRVRFALCAAWCAFLLLAPTYPSSGPSAFMNPRTPLPVLPSHTTTRAANGTITATPARYFIAANLYDYSAHLPAWTGQLSRLIAHLGPENVFVSIYESNSHDATKDLLRVFETQLNRAGVRNRVLLDEDGRRREGWQSNGHERVQYMADMRNRALEPLKEEGVARRRFDKVLFFNDVYFDWKAIVRLLATKDGEFDLACGLDFDGIGLYDTWVIRDACGQRTKELWPYFSLSSDPAAVASLRRGAPVEVATCWNGVAAFGAAWFAPEHALPLAFRADTPCPESECFLIGYDMHLRSAPRRPRVYVNPRVEVAYTPHTYLYYASLKHLSLTRPWRVVWEDWIAHRIFGWVADYYWLTPKAGERCAFEEEGIVKAGWCAKEL
ncbi:capsular associated protein [Mycena albidolilacea]|uniref:Capsular associated protein n=1 Tax=Mycena albidolilacea TaxID=1033008 RepID=A0AAD6Z0K0_9AGAR|nr:capsular associated protein [Mycena albidolilacea]